MSYTESQIAVGTGFVSNSQTLLVLYALNLGPHRCLRAGGVQCGFIGADYGFAVLHICSDCGLKTNLVCEPMARCLRAVTPSRRPEGPPFSDAI